MANFSSIDRLVKDLASALATEVRAQMKGNRANRQRRKRTKGEMVCRVAGCKNRSKGPRFGYICEEHLRKLSKVEQRSAREKWNAKHAA